MDIQTEGCQRWTCLCYIINSLGSNGIPGGIDFSQGTRKPDGRLCIMKEEEVDTLVKEPVLECTHKNVEKCHYTYVTQFIPSKEEVCMNSLNICRDLYYILTLLYYYWLLLYYLSTFNFF